MQTSHGRWTAIVTRRCVFFHLRVTGDSLCDFVLWKTCKNSNRETPLPTVGLPGRRHLRKNKRLTEGRGSMESHWLGGGGKWKIRACNREMLLFTYPERNQNTRLSCNISFALCCWVWNSGLQYPGGCHSLPLSHTLPLRCNILIGLPEIRFH